MEDPLATTYYTSLTLSTLLVAPTILSLTIGSFTPWTWSMVVTSLLNLSYTSSTLYFPCPASCTSKSTNSTLSPSLKQPATPLW